MPKKNKITPTKKKEEVRANADFSPEESVVNQTSFNPPALSLKVASPLQKKDEDGQYTQEDSIASYWISNDGSDPPPDSYSSEPFDYQNYSPYADYDQGQNQSTNPEPLSPYSQNMSMPQDNTRVSYPNTPVQVPQNGKTTNPQGNKEEELNDQSKDPQKARNKQQAFQPNKTSDPGTNNPLNQNKQSTTPTADELKDGGGKENTEPQLGITNGDNPLSGAGDAGDNGTPNSDQANQSTPGGSPQSPGGGPSNAPSTKGGGGGSGKYPTIDQWQQKVSTATTDIPQDEMLVCQEADEVLSSKGDSIEEKHKSNQPDYGESIDKAISDPPETENEPVPEVDPLEQETKDILNPHKDKLLPEQRMPALNPTPSGIMPRLGDSTQLVALENQIAELEKQVATDDLTSGGMDPSLRSENQAKLDKLRKIKEQAIPEGTPSGQGEGLLIEDKGEPPRPELPEAMQNDVGAVLARLLSDSSGVAKDMLTSIRISAFPDGILHKIYEDLGEHELPELTALVEGELEAIAEDAGISEKELQGKVKEEELRIQQKQLEAQEQMSLTMTSEQENLEQMCIDETALIAGTKEGADKQMEAQMAAAQGANDPEVIKKKAARIRKNVNKEVGKQRGAYDRTKIRRQKQLENTKTVYVQAYEAAALREKQASPSANDNNPLNLEAAAIAIWKNKQIRAVEQKIAGFKASSNKTIDQYKLNIKNAGSAALDRIEEWEEDQSGTKKSWWERLLQMFADWFQSAEAEAEVWEQVQVQETRDALTGNLQMLEQTRMAVGENVDIEAIKANKNLNSEQKAIFLSYYGGGPNAGDSIAAVAAGMKVRLTNNHRPQFLKKFNTWLEEKPASEWEMITEIARSINPSFNADKIRKECYAAMKGGLTGWGTDEDRVYKALSGLTKLEVLAVEKCYQDTHNGASLKAHIDDEFSGAEWDRAMALYEGNAIKADAAALYYAMKGGITGLGTDEEAIMAALRGKTEEEKLQLIEYYKKEYGRDLKKDIDGELSSHDQDRADALWAGNTAKADAISIDQAMNGGIFGWGTNEQQIEDTYGQIRKDAEDDASKKRAQIQAMANQQGWTAEQLTKTLKDAGVDSAGIEADVSRRNAQTETEYNSEYGHRYDTSNGESALRLEFEDESRTSELDLFNALADNDRTAVDAAKLANEFNNSYFYASDKTTNEILRNQYDRALSELKTDEWPAIEMELNRKAKKEGWDRYRIAEEKRKAEAQLEQKARGRGTELMGNLTTTYDSKYSGVQNSMLDGVRMSGGLKDDVERYTQGYGEDKAMDLMNQGGYLTTNQQIKYATYGAGTQEADLKAVFEGKTQEEIAEITKNWNDAHEDDPLMDRVEWELSGRDEFDTKMAMRGLPKDVHEDMQNMRDKFDWEMENESNSRFFAYGISYLMAPPIGLAAGEYVHDNFFGGSEADILRDRMAFLEKQYELINDPNLANSKDKFLADKYFQQGTENVGVAIEGYREQKDAVANGIASIAAITAAVVVGAVLTVLSGGTAAPGVAAAISGIAGALGTTTTAVIAGASSLAALAATVATKKMLLGNAYGDEDMLIDMGVGAVDVVAAITTAGVGNAVLRGVRLADLADSPALRNRLLAALIAEGSEGMISSVPSALAGNIANDANWAKGNPITNILKNTMTESAMSGGISAGLGSFGAFKDPNVGVHVDADAHVNTPDAIDGTTVDINGPDVPHTDVGTVDTGPIDINSPDTGPVSTTTPDVTPAEVNTPKPKPKSKSEALASSKGYPEAPPGYRWNSNGDTVYLQRLDASASAKVAYDPKSGKFVEIETGRVFDSATDLVGHNKRNYLGTGGSSGTGGLDADGFRVEAEGVEAGSKSIDDVTIEPEGLEDLKKHLRQEFFTDGAASGQWDHNEVMISRLEKILAGDLEATPADLNFYAHETGEAKLMAEYMGQGMTIEEAYTKAHAVISKEYGVTGKKEVGTFYTKEAQDAMERQMLREADMEINSGGYTGGNPHYIQDGPYKGKPVAPPGYHYNRTSEGKIYIQRGKIDDMNPKISLKSDGSGFYLSDKPSVTFDTAEEVVRYKNSLKDYQVSGKPVVYHEKGSRPLPAEYMTPAQIAEHLEKFEDGVSCLTFQSSMDKYGQVGRNDGLFVLSKADMDDLMRRTGGDIDKIQVELGIPDDIWKKRVMDPTNPDKLIRVDVSNPHDLNLRMASGNEGGANDMWIPGGKTLGGVDEAIVDPIKPGDGLVTPTNVDDMGAHISSTNPEVHAIWDSWPAGKKTAFFKDFVVNPKGFHETIGSVEKVQAWEKIQAGLEKDARGVHGYLPKEGTRYHKSRDKFMDPTWVAEQRAIRESYLEASKDLEKAVQKMRSENQSSEEIARFVVDQRNLQKVEARKKMNPADVKNLETGNLKKYGNPVGPDADYLYAKYNDWEKIIEASLRKDPVINTLLGLE